MTGTRDPLNAFLDVPQVPVPSAQSGLSEWPQARRQGYFRCRRLSHRLRQSRQVRGGTDSHAHDAGGAGDSRPGRAIRRQDPDRRARLFADGHQCAFSGAGEFRRAGPRHRRLLVRIGGRRRRRAGEHRGRLGHRRLDPRPGEFLRADRLAHHPWPHFARRSHAARALARHVRLVCRRHRDLRGGRPHPARPRRPSRHPQIGRSPWRGWTRW